jgi:hypothetical protein
VLSGAVLCYGVRFLAALRFAALRGAVWCAVVHGAVSVRCHDALCGTVRYRAASELLCGARCPTMPRMAAWCGAVNCLCVVPPMQRGALQRRTALRWGARCFTAHAAQCGAVLRFSVRCVAVPCRAVLRFVVLCGTCDAVLRVAARAALHCIASFVECGAALCMRRGTALCMRHGTALYCTVVCSTVLYLVVQCCVERYCASPVMSGAVPCYS